MRTFKIVYLLVGIILAAFVLAFAAAGLPSEDRKLYGAACELVKRAPDSIWPGLSVQDYPVAIRKGMSEYVVQKDDVKKRTPVLPVTACTAYPVNGEMNVFLPSKSTLDSIGQIAEGLSSDPQYFFMSRFYIKSEKLSDNQYISVLYHETLHAFQYTYFERQLRDMEPECEESEIELLLDDASHDTVISLLEEKLTALLYTLVNAQDKLPGKAVSEDYLSARKALKEAYTAKFGQDKAKMIGRYIERTETVEGTARYAEYKTADALGDSDLMRRYLTGLKENVKGKEKYYRSGMAICLLLDRCDPGWKQNVFAGPESPAALFEKAVKRF